MARSSINDEPLSAMSPARIRSPAAVCRFQFPCEPLRKADEGKPELTRNYASSVVRVTHAVLIAFSLARAEL